ncbi:hypothetical protein F5Y09DRAFT_307718 [Xylaria sp. FL1042]|nr:hypothetical protein F5Y09DRAFT_307718 [Xylaria sp. FL1042]
MSALTRWFFSFSPRRGPSSPSTSSRTLSPDQRTNKVLHGRITKPGHTSNSTKRKAPAKYDEVTTEEEEEEEASFTVSLKVDTPAKRIDECDSETQKIAGKVKKEEEDNDGDDEDEQDDHGADSPEPEPVLKHDPTSEPGPDTKFGLGTESDLDIESDSDTESGLDIKPDPDTETGSDKAWRVEQIYLNTILNARQEFTLMPSTWRMHFRGIPLPDSLFYFKTKLKSDRPRIYARSDKLEYRGALALRRLIDINARIQDIRSNEADAKQNEELNEAEKHELIKTLSADMARRLKRALELALYWAKQDGEIDKYGDQLPSNVRIVELSGSTRPNEPDSGVRIQNELCDLAEEWRIHASNRKAPVRAPVLFGFVILKHIITIVTLDASDPEAVFHVPCQLQMAERNQHQWNALAILVTVCWARDVLIDYITAHPDLQPEVKSESSDPDA